MNSPLLVNKPPHGVHFDPTILSPKLLCGETIQGFMTAEFKEERMLVEHFSRDHQGIRQIRLLL
jgi:hypothetical protein